MRQRYIIRLCVYGLSGLLLLGITFAQAKANTRADGLTWSQWVQQLRQEALAKGVRAKTFDRAFRNIHAPKQKILRYDRNQPERRLTYLQYRKSRVNAYRIRLGRKEYRKYRGILQQVAKIYQVRPGYILALWGMESSYGRYRGKHPVIQSLATLAYDPRRSAFFRKQLLYALQILDQGHVSLAQFKGEWAGASGHPQFLPSSWYHYAVDHDQDGRKDIWNTHADVFASIANYLHQNGWKHYMPVLVKVRANKSLAHYQEGLKYQQSIAKWRQQGIKLPNKTQVHDGTQASLVYPLGGPLWLAFPNFKVLMRWNRSIYFVGSINYLATAIMKGK